ncbi:hypothetical protein HRI_003459100 [Hibiscus trionum]|uniref:Pre-mRNA-processing factor 19 n=1 Tax=Hibiscus trionum TaxID=183268 RepID=A0A9W7HCV9_HIBTR|nr:hypothetical protein HRI_001196300 [Hibiscus trionum]GMI79091.1 hypothetical protein HRI_001578400 [Hibiscus trionum]GMI82651.1 hypothetical protein HRI_001934400 [Hibiscus trionum]GMI97898.1 hypothetical protein HRI_003459100 [Hibiscus trionum]
MNCSISGEVPEEPVVSIKSCLLYEKRLIERHISDYGKCLVTWEELNFPDGNNLLEYVNSTYIIMHL